MTLPPQQQLTRIWKRALVADPKLYRMPSIKSITCGNLLASFSGGKLVIVLDDFAAVIEPVPSHTHGVANMRGAPLPPLPDRNGTFEVFFTATTCTVRIRDHSGSAMMVDVWNGVGLQAGLTGTWSGTWVRLEHDTEDY
ncbi:hypothetical protein EIP91_010491 [Steccherinum ochraceum]|uniref:Uncharacterized protein n=1 Tax=Steccherinum ochraceum TaxID=92696 RepID=A0A4R0RLV7_9APHY|nr:hypothetical protein EIP91_010491 [Steccherinum ochraceum]